MKGKRAVRGYKANLKSVHSNARIQKWTTPYQIKGNKCFQEKYYKLKSSVNHYCDFTFDLREVISSARLVTDWKHFRWTCWECVCASSISTLIRTPSLYFLCPLNLKTPRFPFSWSLMFSYVKCCVI